jgi:two-component system alkaline phosphatase synthesis response regulator PhoP
MPKQILVCDDDLHIVAAAGFRLRSGGYDVIGAGDGEEAWEQIQNHVPDLLITDYCMPRLDGIELCKRIRDCERTRHLPIFLLTAKSLDRALPALADEFGVLDLIPKPFSPRDLLRRVDQALEAFEATAGL